MSVYFEGDVIGSPCFSIRYCEASTSCHNLVCKVLSVLIGFLMVSGFDTSCFNQKSDPNTWSFEFRVSW